MFINKGKLIEVRRVIKYQFYIVVNSPDSLGGCGNFVFSNESLTDLGLSRILPVFLPDNPENNFMQAYLSISLSFRMK